jgi:hypothetical protein
MDTPPLPSDTLDSASISAVPHLHLPESTPSSPASSVHTDKYVFRSSDYGTVLVPNSDAPKPKEKGRPGNKPFFVAGALKYIRSEPVLAVYNAIKMRPLNSARKDAITAHVNNITHVLGERWNYDVKLIDRKTNPDRTEKQAKPLSDFKGVALIDEKDRRDNFSTIVRVVSRLHIILLVSVLNLFAEGQLSAFLDRRRRSL